MALVSGHRLGPYEVLAAIGTGGMGEVYRARDTRLERTVAIKILQGAQAPTQISVVQNWISELKGGGRPASN